MTASCRLRLKVVPGARTASVEWMGELLKVKVTEAPEKGRANDAVIELLAQRLGLNTSALSLISGHTSPFKTLEVCGLALEEVQRQLG
jgi:uncharacterized protein YggU (UPF0235/DUF167 family)